MLFRSPHSTVAAIIGFKLYVDYRVRALWLYQKRVRSGSAYLFPDATPQNARDSDPIDKAAHACQFSREIILPASRILTSTNSIISLTYSFTAVVGRTITQLWLSERQRMRPRFTPSFE